MSELSTSNIVIEYTTDSQYIGYDLTKKIYGKFDISQARNNKNETVKIFNLFVGVNIIDQNNILFYYDKKKITITHNKLLIKKLHYEDSHYIHNIKYGKNYEIDIKYKHNNTRILISNVRIEASYGNKYEIDLSILNTYPHIINDKIILPIKCDLTNEFENMLKLENYIFIECYKNLIMKLENKTEEIKCIICLDKKPTYIIMNCAHLVYCEDCEKKKNNTCPVCRSAGTTKRIYY
jgi:hypothetical protein